VRPCFQSRFPPLLLLLLLLLLQVLSPLACSLLVHSSVIATLNARGPSTYLQRVLQLTNAPQHLLPFLLPPVAQSPAPLLQAAVQLSCTMTMILLRRRCARHPLTTSSDAQQWALLHLSRRLQRLRQRT